MKAALKKVKRLEDLGFTRGILDGAIVRMKQIAEEKKARAEIDADLPEIPGGSLGTFKNGLQSLPLKTREVLGDKVKVKYKLINVKPNTDNNGKTTWTATFDTPNGKKTYKTKSIILTAPSYVTAPIVESVLPEV